MQMRHCHYWTCLIWGWARYWKSLGKQTSDAAARHTQEINLVNCQICKHANWSHALPWPRHLTIVPGARIREHTHTATGTNTQAHTPLISSALLYRWYSALCPLTQCMPLITNSHDKSIAHRIHDGRWRVFLLGHSYWTFLLHTTLKIGFQSTCLILQQLGTRAVFPQWLSKTAAIQPPLTANGRVQIPDSLPYNVWGQNILIHPVQGCLAALWTPLNSPCKKTNIKHSSTSPKQRKSPQRWYSPPLTVTKMKIKCRKSRHPTKDLFSFLFLQWKLIEFVC